MGDRGIPKTWGNMDGFSSDTYMWVNARGEKFWVKYHFKTDQGIEFLTQAEADQIASEDGDYHQRDLYQSIARGDHPSWTLKMQVMPFEDAKTYRFNPFDLTKVWPHGDYPLVEVGRLTLDRNVSDYHTEMEQAAFEPNNPLGQGPAVWFQQMDAPRPQRNRIHFDISVPHDEAPRRIEATLAAGGKLLSDTEAPAFWVLADPEGNEACITTWQGRD